ncbi:MAG: DUF2213 domain-containing protein [Thermoplasmata archaeon]
METTSEEDDTDPSSLMINELNFNDNEDLEGLMNFTEEAKIESEWQSEDGFMTAPVSFCSATVCNNTLKTWDEIQKTWQMWEGRPVTFEHPDQMVVKNPTDIIGFLGEVEKDEEKKRLKGKLYVMQEPAEFNQQDENYWKVMLQALKDRDEISVGYWAIPENEEGTHTDQFGNELEYEEKVTQILPDHIASVDKGACSPGQGCGIGVEKNIEEDDRMSLLSKIHEKLKTLIENDGSKDEVKEMEIERNEDGSYRIIEERDSMDEEENSEENETEEERSEQSESCDQDEVIERKEEKIEKLREQIQLLKEELNEYRQREIERLRERAKELTDLSDEQLESKDPVELKALIEGASNARYSEPTENSEKGKNLRSPPGSNDADEGPEVIDLYEDPLAEE